MDKLRTLRDAATTFLVICVICAQAVQVDNQLVSVKNDCFERIALGAMLPFEKAFRNIDTNSLKACQEACAKEGERCQTLAFGVHVRGNGTCELSSEKIDGSMTRPAGTIFDPDFDLYARRQNCFDIPPDANTIPSNINAFSDNGQSESSRPPLPFGPVSTTNEMPRPPPSSDSPVATSLGEAQSDTFSPSVGGTRFPPTTDQGNRYPSTDADRRYPTTSRDERYPSTDYNRRPTNGYDVTENEYPSPTSGSYPQRRPSSPYPSYEQNGGNSYSNQERDTIYFSHDLFPLYKYPMLYEHNYPSPNDQGGGYPGVYAQNVPTVEDRYKPPSEIYGMNRPSTPRPFYGLGYGNGYSYGTPSDYGTTQRPLNGNRNGRPIPSYESRPPINDNTYNDRRRPERPEYSQNGSNGNRYQPRPEYGFQDPPQPEYNQNGNNANKYQPRPEYGAQNRPQDGPTTSVRPLDNDYVHRPDPSYSPSGGPTNAQGDGETGYQPSSSPGTKPVYTGNGKPPIPYHPKPGQDSGTNEGNYPQIPGDPIETYFNPEDYYEIRWTTKPGTHYDGDGGYGGNGYGNRHPDTDTYRTCFRRVLAGKRVAPHWVRRTLACERVEDCMHECGHEKRFTCEGFNYRLDPSGHGQGDCELIEVPLSQMDLYSSTQSRDANLLRHPDYDYYERDRNAPTSCRQACTDCGAKPISSPPIHYRPSYDKPAYFEEHYAPPSSSGYGSAPERYRPSDTAIDKYRPPPHSYESRPPPDYSHYDFSSHSYYDDTYHKHSYGSAIDRYDVIHPADRPSHWEIQGPSGHGGGGGGYAVTEYQDRPDSFRPPYKPGPNYSPYRPQHEPDPYPLPPSGSSHAYLDRDRPSYRKPGRFIPYLIGAESDWGSYGGSYGGGTYGKSSDYWGLKNEHRRKDSHEFNYFELGGRRRPYEDNYIWNYPGLRYGFDERHPPRDRPDYGSQWTRRPGPDECSVKSSEGFRIHKGAVKISFTVPTVTECEKLCVSEDKFICNTYSYKYSTVGRENCLLCDRPIHLLDYYVDIEPDRDFDIYAVTDDHKSCRPPHEGPTTAITDPKNNAQCFFRAIDATRFFKSIVRDSLNVRSIGECELECIKSTKFTCRAFSFRYGQRTPGGIIDNCQLSDWPVRDMDKERHLIPDPTFDVFERASYGHGCEIQPIVDDKHKKLCYLGYGSPAKLLSTAIKKVISVPTELECKKECIRYRENTPFKCYSFSFGSHASTFNCEMSDLDQGELKLNIHYSHTHDRDYWLFAWNPFDWTCRDKVTTIGGSRVNNDRRMDIFREPGEVTWRHYTVSGKPCRLGRGCEKNLVTGFYSCEIDGGEIGSWDYCCKADYPCGYSQGFDYPWCFVGDEPDQWRKCSDRYFPGNHTQTHSSVTYSPKDKKKHEHFQRPPRPGGLQSLTDFTAARLWPVTYLYSEGPPNSTEFSNFVDCNKENC